MAMGQAPYTAALDEITEKQFQAQVNELAQRLGWDFRYHTYRSTRSPSGFPDLVLVRERVIFVELKSENGRVTAMQHAWLSALGRAGAEVYVLRPSDLDWFANVLIQRVASRKNASGESEPILVRAPTRTSASRRVREHRGS